MAETMKRWIEESSEPYQRELAEFVRKERPSVVVETGVRNGTSTREILRALDENQHGHLYSIDPDPAYDEPHPRWSLCLGTSFTRMVDIYVKTGPWDIFLHDSDHSCLAQRFEYELAFRFVRDGGFIATDDPTWGNPAHLSWNRFVELYSLKEFAIGHARAVQVNGTGTVRTNPWDHAAECFTVACKARALYKGDDCYGPPLVKP